MNPRAPFCVASFEIRVTSKIRSFRDFLYKYRRQEVSQRDESDRGKRMQEGVLHKFIFRYITVLRRFGMADRIRMG